VEACRIVGRRNSHIVCTIGSQMAKLSALRAGRSLPSGRFQALISDKAEWTPRVIGQLEGLGKVKIAITSLGIELNTLRLVAQKTRTFCSVSSALKEMTGSRPASFSFCCYRGLKVKHLDSGSCLDTPAAFTGRGNSRRRFHTVQIISKLDEDKNVHLHPWRDMNPGRSVHSH
jgi:hypothetical protein